MTGQKAFCGLKTKFIDKELEKGGFKEIFLAIE